MRVTFVLPGYANYPIGGYRIVYEYANRLSERGHNLTVVHPESIRQLPPPHLTMMQQARRGARHVVEAVSGPINKTIPWFPMGPHVRSLYTPSLDARYLPDADAVVATAWQTAEYAMDYPASKGEKFYLIQGYETWSGSKEAVDATWRGPFHTVVIARWLYDLGIELGARDLIHIPNALNFDVFRLMTSIPGRPLRVAMLYNAQEGKGASDGIMALSLVKQRIPTLNAVLFGVSARPEGLPGWIEYVHDVPQEILVRNVYNTSSVYMCPSWSEGWHLPAVEAMACGCALVSTDNGGVRDYAIDEETALLAPPRQPQILAAQLLRACQDEALRTRLAFAGHAAVQRFTWEKSVSAFEAFLNARTGMK